LIVIPPSLRSSNVFMAVLPSLSVLPQCAFLSK
jgi:hypothetical protein